LLKIQNSQPKVQWTNGDAFPLIKDVLCPEAEFAFAYCGTKPVFFGHYWRKWPPKKNIDWTDTTPTVDFSAGAGGALVAYQWSGESSFTEANFVEFPEDRSWTKR
jgi:hypothetical protein